MGIASQFELFRLKYSPVQGNTERRREKECATMVLIHLPESIMFGKWVEPEVKK